MMLKCGNIYGVKTKVFLVFLFLSFAFLPLCFAATPEVTSVSPSVRIRGQDWVLTFTGRNFVTGMSVETSGADILVYPLSITVESSTTLEVRIFIGSFEALGTKDITVRNPSGEASTASGIFTVVAAGTPPSITGLYFDGKPYTYEASASMVAFTITPHNWTTAETRTSFEVTSTATNLASVGIYYDGVLTNLIDSSSATVISGTHWLVDQLVRPGISPSPGAHVITIRAGDDYGNSTAQAATIGVLETPAQHTEKGSNARTPLKTVNIFPVGGKSYVDPETPGGIPIQIRPTTGNMVPPEGVEVLVIQGNKVLAKERFPGAITTKKNVTLKLNNPALGTAIVIVTDVASGKVLSRGPIVFWKQ